MRNPFWVVLIVAADKRDQANAYLENQGYGPNNLSRELILISDPDSQPARGYGCMVQGDRAFRTTCARKAAEIPGAFCFWSIHRKTAKQEALNFITSKGYRLKPK